MREIANLAFSLCFKSLLALRMHPNYCESNES